MRVTDDMVRSVLIWGRNYKEIESYSIVANRGRKWLVRLPSGSTTTISGGDLNVLSTVVPDEMLFTSREAYAFGLGLSVAGDRPETRRLFATREWGWR